MAKLAVILLTCLSVSLAYANDSEEIAAWHEAILANIYDYYPEAECYAYSENGNDYCMAVDLADTLSYEGGYDLYIATKGTNVVARDDEVYVNDCHACSGANGLFIYRYNEQDDSAETLLEAHGEMGNSGEGLSDFELVQIAPEAVAFLAQSGDVHQGYYTSDYMFFIPQNGEVVVSAIGGSASSEGALEETDSGYFELSTQLAVDDSELMNGFYPLQITLEGRQGDRYYNEASYTAIYKPNQGYVVLGDYPLAQD